MSGGYRTALLALFAAFGLSWWAAYAGWWLPNDAEARARSVRQGSVGGRRYLGGGPSFGK